LDSFLNEEKRQKKVQIQVFIGQEIQPYIDQVASLRVSIFREYPYLSEGNLQSEKSYLEMYSHAQNGIFLLAVEGEKVVGVLTGISLVEAATLLQNVFLKRKIPVDPFFYLGDIMVVKEYRNKGVGRRLYERLEKHVRERTSYRQIFFSEIHRSESDPRRPKDYTSADQFWEKLGFVKHPELVTYFPWKEVGGSHETPHTMITWIKIL
jgi:GNAT superfamily N-acetyltransferase